MSGREIARQTGEPRLSRNPSWRTDPGDAGAGDVGDMGSAGRPQQAIQRLPDPILQFLFPPEQAGFLGHLSACGKTAVSRILPRKNQRAAPGDRLPDAVHLPVARPGTLRGRRCPPLPRSGPSRRCRRSLFRSVPAPRPAMRRRTGSPEWRTSGGTSGRGRKTGPPARRRSGRPAERTRGSPWPRRLPRREGGAGRGHGRPVSGREDTRRGSTRPRAVRSRRKGGKESLRGSAPEGGKGEGGTPGRTSPATYLKRFNPEGDIPGSGATSSASRRERRGVPGSVPHALEGAPSATAKDGSRRAWGGLADGAPAAGGRR